MKKTVLFIRANPVKPDSRVEKEVEALEVHGYNVSIFAWDRSDNYQIRKEKLNDRLSNVNIYRVGIKAKYGSGIKNIKNLIKFQIAIRHFLKLHSFDIVHACDFDTAFTAYHSIDHKRTKFVYDIFDYYADAFSVPGFLKNVITTIDNHLINKADLAIICTEERFEQIAGTTPKSLIVVHNTPNNEGYTGDNPFSRNEIIRICYVGILQPGRLLLELGDVIKNNNIFELHIGGFGVYEDYFQKLSEEYKNIRFYGRIPYDQTLKLENSCDIMLAIYDPENKNHRFAAPNKFYEALMLGKPLIMVKGTGMSSVVYEKQLGCLIDYSKEGLTNGLLELASIRDSWEAISKRERTLYREKYSRETMEKRLIDGYRKLLI